MFYIMLWFILYIIYCIYYITGDLCMASLGQEGQIKIMKWGSKRNCFTNFKNEKSEMMKLTQASGSSVYG